MAQSLEDVEPSLRHKFALSSSRIKMSSLPAISALKQTQSSTDSPLAVALSILFEPSPILLNALEPELAALLQTVHGDLTSYEQLIDIAITLISSWTPEQRAQFIAGHPRIGETKNLSNLSAKEQAAVATPPQVLARLVHLNACYEHVYPGLRYITFVNGRSRAVIAEELEVVLGFESSLSPNEPPLTALQPVGPGKKWMSELNRAISAIDQIAKSRLKSLVG